MNEIAFHKGWAAMLCQPWGRDYAFDAAKEAVQIQLFKQKFGGLSDEVWLRVCDWWISHEDHWPLIPQFQTAIQASKPVTTYKLLPAPEVPEDHPPCVILRYAHAHDVSVREACLKILPQWLQDHPHHAERDAAKHLLKQAEARFPVKCDCGQFHPAGEPCAYCDSEEHKAMRLEREKTQRLAGTVLTGSAKP